MRPLRTSLLLDALLALALLALSIGALVAQGGGIGAVGLVLALLAVVPLALRQVAPVLTLLIVDAALVTYVLAGFGEPPSGSIGMVIGMFSVATLRPRLVAAMVYPTTVGVGVAYLKLDSVTWAIVVQAAVIGACAWALGEATRHWAQQAESATAEGRLAATQERLRLANDVHDLQGHHLQVIALQLELAERLLALDAGSALEHVRAARCSVDDARQGTRDLATRFRGVPLADELANAADLLRAAGLRVEIGVAQHSEQAPVEVLGPVIRETTTNALKHSGGRWAQISLRRSGDSWIYTVRNDTVAPHPHASQKRTGHGLRGIDDRVRAVGGHVTVEQGPLTFEVSATVPLAEGQRTQAPSA